MRLLCILLFFCAGHARAAQPAQAATEAKWRLHPVSSLHKLTAREKGVLESFVETPVQLQAARGEWECFQIVVQAGARPVRALQVKATGLATHLAHFIPDANIRLYRENSVLVDHPSGNRRLEKLWWPDALIPLDLQELPDIAPGHSEVLWCAIQVPRDAAPGRYYGEIDITSDNGPKALAVTLQVSTVDLPAPTMRANVALYYDVLRDWYRKSGRDFSDADWTFQKKRFYEFLLDYRLNAYDLPVDWNSPEAERYLTDAKVLSVRLPSLDRPDFPLAIERLKRTKTLPKSYYYWIDEPAPERYEEVRQTTQKLRAIDARIRHCVTVHPNAALQNSVDIWCPNIGDATGLGFIDLKALSEERKRGRETWWYTMVEPKYPYPTWLLDDDAGAVRIYGQLMAQHGISGFVYSMVHGWGPKPLENLRSFADTNGDGTLLYPAEPVGGVGPMPSIRLMLLRDAIEDYELLRAAPAAFKTRRLSPLNPINPLLWTQRQNAPQFFSDWRAELLKMENAEQFTPVDYASSVQTADATPIAPLPTQARIDGALKNGEWTSRQAAQQTVKDRRLDFRRFANDQTSWPATSWYLARDSKYFVAAARARKNAYGDWFAVEIAPRDAGVKWRFVVTAGGKSVVEKYTREGRFQIEGVDWLGASKRFGDYTDYEMKIPLSIVDGAPSFRINALRRLVDANGTRIMLRAVPDAGDARLMPTIFLRATAPKTKTAAPIKTSAPPHRISP